MKNKIHFNMLVNLIRSFFQIVFPLLIFKYVTSIISPQNIGGINFSNSIVNYFIIIANLGISSYSIRECAKIRDSKQKMNNLASELFTISIIASLLSYLLLFLSLFIFSNLSKYYILILIQSSVIIFNAIGTDWVNMVFEDYLYIAIRTIIIQVLSFILILIFVKTNNDYYLYVLITSLSTIVINIINYIYVKKRVHLKLIFNNNLITHLKPIFVIFSINITVTIFVNSDITLLGVLATETAVALYSIPAKIYSAIKTVLVAITSVSIPRLSVNFENNKKKYYLNLQTTIETLIFFGVPIVFLVNCIPGNVIVILSDSYYISTIPMLRVLSFAIIPTMLSTIINNNIFLSERKERYSLRSAIIASAINIVLNILFIPLFGAIVAAITTLISEIVEFFICVYYARNTLSKLNFLEMYLNLKKTIFGGIFIMFLYLIFTHIFVINTMMSIVFVFVSLIMYIFLECLLRHKLVINASNFILKKLHN